MGAKDLRQLAREVINKEKWWDMLSRFIDVLRINICIIDSNGLVILPPEEGRYGGKLLTDPVLKFDLVDDAIKVQEMFEQQGMYLEAANRYGLHSFAIPITVDKDQVIGYLIIGPVILNKRLSATEYEEMARVYDCDRNQLLDELGGIRVVSNIMMNSILDLLTEIVRDNIELSLKKKQLEGIKADTGVLSGEFSEKAQEIYSTVYLDGLLATLLDVALKMTNAECGSILVMDAEQNELVMKASRGLDSEHFGNARIKLGEGIAGLAAQENTSFMIQGTEGDNRIKPFLKRPEIKEALVMPLTNKEEVFGVLNLHTKREGGSLGGSLNNLKYLSELLSSAL